MLEFGDSALPIKAQAELLALSRSGLYYRPAPPPPEELDECTPLFVALSTALTGPFLNGTPLLGAAISAMFSYRSLLVVCLMVYVIDIGIAAWALRAPQYAAGRGPAVAEVGA